MRRQIETPRHCVHQTLERTVHGVAMLFSLEPSAKEKRRRAARRRRRQLRQLETVDGNKKGKDVSSTEKEAIGGRREDVESTIARIERWVREGFARRSRRDDAEDTSRRTRLRTLREYVFDHEDDDEDERDAERLTISVSQIRCLKAGCPPIETVVILFVQSRRSGTNEEKGGVEDPIRINVAKASEDVRERDVVEAIDRWCRGEDATCNCGEYVLGAYATMDDVRAMKAKMTKEMYGSERVELAGESSRPSDDVLSAVAMTTTNKADAMSAMDNLFNGGSPLY